MTNIVLKVAIVVSAAVLICFIAILTSMANHQDDDPLAKVEAACRQEFESQGEAMVGSCKLRIMTKRLEDSENAKLDQAERRSR